MQYYFQSKDAEICYTREVFDDLMRFEGTTTKTVFKAVKSTDKSVFWCKCYNEAGETGSCGKSCDAYKPKNKKSGVCAFHSRCYEHGEEVTLKLNQ